MSEPVVLEPLQPFVVQDQKELLNCTKNSQIVAGTACIRGRFLVILFHNINGEVLNSTLVPCFLDKFCIISTTAIQYNTFCHQSATDPCVLLYFALLCFSSSLVKLCEVKLNTSCTLKALVAHRNSSYFFMVGF